MTKLKPHEIFMAGMVSGTDYTREAYAVWLDKHSEVIKFDFFYYTGIQWPHGVSVMDCWKKMMAETKEEAEHRCYRCDNILYLIPIDSNEIFVEIASICSNCKIISTETALIVNKNPSFPEKIWNKILKRLFK